MWNFVLGLVAAVSLCAADPVITVYNQNFAVIRESVAVSLKPGVNEIRYNGATAHLEPESVVLRDPDGAATFRILEQNFLSEPVSEGLLLALNEGKTLDFLVSGPGGETTVKGRLIRAGYVPHSRGLARYSQPGYAQVQMYQAYGNPGTSQPLVEVAGRLMFTLPGRPVFPALADDSILKPTLVWRLEAPSAAAFDAEVSYLSGGFSWDADYNLVLAEQNDLMNVTGWVTVDNQSGKSLRKARLKLVAGDVQRVTQAVQGNVYASQVEVRRIMEAGPQVVTREFDDYHMLTVERPVDLADRETKQIEFLSAAKVKSRRFYVYDGRTREQGNEYANSEGIIDNPAYGVKSHPKVWIMREFENRANNGLGIALPRGRAKFYRRDRDGRLEFIGESLIDHTPRNEKVTVYTGNSFDLTGSRRRTAFQRKDEGNRPTITETYEIRLKNHRGQPARIAVIEHLNRGANWTVQSSSAYRKQDSHTIEFQADVKPEDESSITYTVRYTW